MRRLKPSKIVGKKRSRDRVLTDDEIFAFWRAADRMPYPFGPLYRLLLLTGLRLNEAADASWPEFDSRQQIWTLPPSRMKGEDDRAVEHVVPVTTDVYAILKSLPEIKDGNYLFSTSFGEKPVWVSDKVKKRLDARMLLTLKALARKRGEDPRRVKLKPWVNHDLRRTLRTGLPAYASIVMFAKLCLLIHGQASKALTIDMNIWTRSGTRWSVGPHMFGTLSYLPNSFPNVIPLRSRLCIRRPCNAMCCRKLPERL